MQDLVDLNRRIVRNVLWKNAKEMTPQQEQYLGFLPVCVARLSPCVADIRKMLFGVRPRQENTLPDMQVNCDYLNYCRLAGKDIGAGRYSRLIELGLKVEEAEAIAGLANEQITRLALYWPGLIAVCDLEIFLRGAMLHSWAGRFHASAYLTAERSEVAFS